jgi:hypothetical protein
MRMQSRCVRRRLQPCCLRGRHSQRPFQRRPTMGDVVRLEAADFGEALDDSLDPSRPPGLPAR